MGQCKSSPFIGLQLKGNRSGGREKFCQETLTILERILDSFPFDENVAFRRLGTGTVGLKGLDEISFASCGHGRLLIGIDIFFHRDSIVHCLHDQCGDSSVGVGDRYVEQALLKEVRKEVHCCPMSLCWQNSVTDQLNDPMNNKKIGGAQFGERERDRWTRNVDYKERRLARDRP